MKKSKLIWIPLILAAGALVARHCAKDMQTLADYEPDPEAPTRDDPVYLRETATDGHGL
ncbi:hypothetical protein PQ472_00610 [Lacticaseibacillus pabuli]|uniref:Secreted protein n=1 Tax=Lacticaseibacillus pabuli TaxID=3025672 RepID=A0ABY7WSK6_9LACO|nr:hypothetical protein [Lacticaseibacillus sp. KACC 23028]WDF82774.1 hypothetical protein PQ472_00610 [Lacticaseibacillus sp. KACC 23028]